MKKIIPYGKCYIDSHDINEVKKSLKNSYLTSGPFVKKLENNIKKKLKVKYAVSCNSGTAALHLAFISIGLKKKDIVILPVINFVAASNILKMMDIKIIYSDVDINTGQITPAAIEECIKKKDGIVKDNSFVPRFGCAMAPLSPNFKIKFLHAIWLPF